MVQTMWVVMLRVNRSWQGLEHGQAQRIDVPGMLRDAEFKYD